MPRQVTPLLAALAAFAAALAWLPRCDAEAASVARGERIYRLGESPSGDPLTVTLPLFGDAARAVPATRYACANCHGPEGLPKTEGGVAVADIRPHRLAAELRASGTQRRTRRPYDDASLGRAIRMGRDASGNALNPLMPLFDISDRDLADLRAYLAQLGNQAVPGVSATEIAVAAVVPTGDLGDAVLATLRAAVADTNGNGGIYDRRIRIDAVAAETFTARTGDEWLCAVAPTDLPPDLSPRVPLVGALAFDPMLDAPLRDNVFWLQSSQTTQLRVAIDHWCTTPEHTQTRFLLLLPADTPADVGAAMTTALAAQTARHPQARVLRGDADAFVAAAPSEPTVALLAGPPEWKARLLSRLLARTDVEAVYTTHRLPPEVFGALEESVLARLRLVAPVAIPAEEDPALAAFRTFLARHELPATHVGARLAALVAAATLTEGLKRCGADVTQGRLVHAVGTMHRFQPGLFPPLSFDLNHHVGADGAQVLGIDPATRTPVPQTVWSAPR